MQAGALASALLLLGPPLDVAGSTQIPVEPLDKIRCGLAALRPLFGLRDDTTGWQEPRLR